MLAHLARGTRLRVFRTLTMALVLAATASVATAQLPTIVRVEEDWQVVVSTPDPNCDAPQITTALLPDGSTDGLFATFEVNYQDIPDYVPGGMQLQLWNGDSPTASRKFPNPSVCATPGETIRWTQAIAVNDGTLTFEIVNGTSSTWGSFGGQGYLRSSVETSLVNLNSYDAQQTIANSRVGFASNRVDSLTLVSVRLYTDTGAQLNWP